MNRASTLRRTLAYFHPDRPRILLLLGVIAASTVLGLLQVWPLAFLVDSVLAQMSGRGRLESRWLALLPDSPAAQIVLLAVFAFALRVGQELLNVVRGMAAMRINHNGILRVRCDLYRKLQSLSLLYHRSKPQADTIYRLTTDAGSCQALLNVTLDVLVAAITLCVMLGIMATRSLWLTAISLAVVPLLVATNFRFARVLKAHTRDAKEIDSQFLAQVQRSVSTITLITAFGRESLEMSRFQQKARSNLQAWYHLHWNFSLYRLCVGLIFGAGGALIFGLGGWQVYHDQFLAATPGGMTPGDLVIFITYLAMFYDPLCKLTGAGASLQEAIAGSERVFEILDRDPIIADAPDAIDLPPQPRTLTLREVTFDYPDGSRVLRGVDAVIKPGQMVAFVGASGAGKSTLLNLFPRFFDPVAGAVELDGIDIRRVKLQDLRRHVALVLQESVILPTTIRENIAYGRAVADDEQIYEAAKLAGVHGFVQSLAAGYETTISEGGQNLSGGQRQRIAIARALLTQAPILVLDEPTSALDPAHERLVTETLEALKGQRTIVVVSHRLSTVAQADQIFVMEGGAIVERGTHDELMDLKGLYHSMARQQSRRPRREMAAA